MASEPRECNPGQQDSVFIMMMHIIEEKHRNEREPLNPYEDPYDASQATSMEQKYVNDWKPILSLRGKHNQFYGQDGDLLPCDEIEQEIDKTLVKTSFHFTRRPYFPKNAVGSHVRACIVMYGHEFRFGFVKASHASSHMGSGKFELVSPGCYLSSSEDRLFCNVIAAPPLCSVLKKRALIDVSKVLAAFVLELQPFFVDVLIDLIQQYSIPSYLQTAATCT